MKWKKLMKMLAADINKTLCHCISLVKKYPCMLFLNGLIIANTS